MRAWPLALLFATLATTGSAEAQVSGRANVLTSDSFALGGQVFRLHGVDAVEFHQFCFVDGEPWACGAAATRAFQVLLDPVRVTCEPTGEETPAGAFAVCTSEEGDIAEIMVRQGWALAVTSQTDAYVAAEAEAREAGTGIWRGRFIEPWEYRADVAAIEDEVIARTISELRAEATESLLVDTAYVPFPDTVVTADAVNPDQRSLLVLALGRGFLGDAIPERGVFNWIEPARVMDGWRRGIVTQVRNAAGEAVGRGFETRAGELVATEDEATFYAALTAQAEAMRNAGFQPVLVVTGGRNPEWLGPWFNEAAPEGAVITLPDPDEEAPRPSYVGTIDGIEVHRAAVPEGIAYLAAAGAVEEVAFAPIESEDMVVALDAVDGEQLRVTFGIEIRWADSPIIAIGYPPAPPDNPYGS